MTKNKYPEETNRIFRAFIECRDALVSSILKMSVKPEDVDDILQETFYRTYSANHRKEIKSPKDYMFVVSRNLVFRGVTTRSREIITIVDDTIFDIEESSLDEEHYEFLKTRALSEALETLPENNRRAILLRKVYGFSSREIAKKMGVSKSSVDKYIASGIKTCEQILEAKGYDIGAEYGNDNTLINESNEK